MPWGRQNRGVRGSSVFNFSDRGFAFSQEPGQDKIVTEQLSSRIGAALLKQIQSRASNMNFEQDDDYAEDMANEDGNFMINSKVSNG